MRVIGIVVTVGGGRGGTVIMMDSGCFFGGVDSYQNLICLKFSDIHALV